MNVYKQEILVLGSGTLTNQLIYGLIHRNNTSFKFKIKVVSNDKQSLRDLEKKYEISTRQLNIVKDKEVLLTSITESNLVISLLPDDLQYVIALYCIEKNKNLVSTSLITEELETLNKEAKKRGLIFLFECGCNPGIDHIIAAKVVNEAQRRKSVILKYENWSGAIPSPESTDNPILFKITNSSLESLKGMLTDSTQLIDSKVKKTKEKNLLEKIVSKGFHNSYNLEGYYTRNYSKYKTYYNLQNVETILCGSIRYQGFTFLIQAFKYLELFSNSLVDEKFKTWRELLSVKLVDPRNESSLYNIQSIYVPRDFNYTKLNLNLRDDVERFFYFRLTLYALTFFDRNFITQNGFENLFNRLYNALVFLKFYDEDNRITSGVTIFKAFSNLLENMLTLKDWERDLIYLKNLFRLKNSNGKVIEKNYELLLYGNKTSTATAFLVGRTCAVCAQCLLAKRYSSNLQGICVPFDEIIADEVLKEMKNLNIKIIDTTNLVSKF